MVKFSLNYCFPSCIVGPPMLCLSIWKDDAGPVMPLLNLVGVSGLLVGPLIVKPFLNHRSPLLYDRFISSSNSNCTEEVDENYYSNRSRNSSTLEGIFNGDSFGIYAEDPTGVSAPLLVNTTPGDGNSSGLTTTTSMEHSSIAYVFVIVSVCSLVVGFFMLLFFVSDFSDDGRPGDDWKSRKFCNARPSPTSAKESSAKKDSNFINHSSDSFPFAEEGALSKAETLLRSQETEPLHTESDLFVKFLVPPTPQSLIEEGAVREYVTGEDLASTKKRDAVTSRLKLTLTLFFFLLNIFLGGIAIGYAALVTTFAVKYLDWSEDDGNSVNFVFHVSNVAANGVAAVLSRWIQPQVANTRNLQTKNNANIIRKYFFYVKYLYNFSSVPHIYLYIYIYIYIYILLQLHDYL